MYRHAIRTHSCCAHIRVEYVLEARAWTVHGPYLSRAAGVVPGTGTCRALALTGSLRTKCLLVLVTTPSRFVTGIIHRALVYCGLFI